MAYDGSPTITEADLAAVRVPLISSLFPDILARAGGGDVHVADFDDELPVQARNPRRSFNPFDYQPVFPTHTRSRCRPMQLTENGPPRMEPVYDHSVTVHHAADWAADPTPPNAERIRDTMRRAMARMEEQMLGGNMDVHVAYHGEYVSPPSRYRLGSHKPVTDLKGAVARVREAYARGEIEIDMTSFQECIGAWAYKLEYPGAPGNEVGSFVSSFRTPGTAEHRLFFYPAKHKELIEAGATLSQEIPRRILNVRSSILGAMDRYAEGLEPW